VSKFNIAAAFAAAVKTGSSEELEAELLELTAAELDAEELDAEEELEVGTELADEDDEGVVNPQLARGSTRHPKPMTRIATFFFIKTLLSLFFMN
jgi:hypothetical protein